MTLVHDPVDSLIGGVSQQAAALRFKNQAERIENCWLSPTQGLVPRPHTAHRSKVFDGKGGPFFAHLIDRDRLERYTMLVRQEELLVHDLRGGSYPVRWDGRQLLKDVTDPAQATWTETDPSGGLTVVPNSGNESPLGDTDDDVIQFAVTAVGANASVEQDINPIGGPDNPRSITSGRPYIFWGWFKPDSSPVGKTRIELEGITSGRITLIEIDWDASPDPAISLFTPTGDGRHKHGMIHRADGWEIPWVVIDWDSTDDPDGFTVRITPDIEAGGIRALLGWRMMCEEWDPTLEEPSLNWADSIDTSAQGLIDNTSYFDFRQANDIVDPENFLETASAGAWTLGSAANPAVVSAFPNPFAYAAGNQFYQKLEHAASGAEADGGYEQVVGVIYPGPQIFGCYFRKEDSDATTVRLNVRDTVGAQSSVVNFDWSGTDLVPDDSSVAGAILDYGVVQSPFDPEDWLAWIAVHPNEHASVTAGNSRKLFVYVWEDGAAVRHTYAFGALLLEGERAARFLDYLNPLRNLRALSIADSTFIVNPDVATRKFTLETPEDPTENLAYVFVKLGGYDQEYVIRINYTDGTSDEVYATTWNGTATKDKCVLAHGKTQSACEAAGGIWQVAAEEIENSETSEIAAKLAQDIDDLSGVRAVAIGSVIEIEITGAKKGGSFEVEDSQGGEALVLIWKDVSEVQELPKVMRDQYRIRITGDTGEAAPDYYLMFLVEGESGTMGPGRWVESTYWSTEDFLDASTMPHQVRRLQDDSTGERTGTPNQIFFELRYAPWLRRLVGDDDTNPFPAFVSTDDADAFIDEIFFFQSRLGVLSGETLALSEVDRFFNPFRSTVIDLNDADAIGASASHTEVSLLRQAIVLDERMLVSSDRVQFVVEGDQFISPKTIQVIPKLTREILRRPHMVSSGRGVFAAFPRRADSDDDFDFSGVLEILPTGGGSGAQLVPDDLTDAVPAYLEGEVEIMAQNASVGLLLVVTDAGRCYPFKHFTAGNQDVQQAWSEWIFGDDAVAFCGLARTEAVYLIRREEGVFLETMRVGENLVDDGSTILTRLDRRLDHDDVTMAHDAVDDETTITLPYDVRTGATMLAVDQDTLVSYTTLSAVAGGTSLVVQGDVTAKNLWIGETYEALFEFSAPFLRTSDVERSVRKLTAGKTIVLNGKLVFAETAAFDVSVAHRHGDTFQAPYSSFQIGTPDADLDAVVLLEGEHEFGIGGFAEDVTIIVTSRAHLPFQLLSALWEGEYAPRSSPVRG